jgi:cell division protein FtsI/penicillin-binding protein 2
VAGKTGTAQSISNAGRAAAGQTERDLRDHGWFVFFAPRDNPQVAGVVFAEHGEHGSTAAPIARHALETLFAKREGRPLPLLDPSRIIRNSRATVLADTSVARAGQGGIQ